VSIQFVDDQDLAPVQAADVFAYEAGKRFIDYLFYPERPSRESLRLIGTNETLRIQYYDRENLEPRMKMSRG
jgi:hypothetical protein